MKFYFCEKCGVRLTEKDIAAGAGMDKKLAGVYCASCAAGVLTMEMLPVTDEDIAAHKAAEAKPAAKPLPPPHAPPRMPPPARRSTSAGALPAHRPPAHASRARPHREPPAAPAAPASEPGSRKFTVIAFAVGAAVLAAVLLFVFASGDASSPRSASGGSGPSGEKSEAPASPESPEPPAKTKARPAQPAQPAQPTRPAPAKTEPPRTAPTTDATPPEAHPRVLQLPDNEDLKKELACYRPFEFGDVTEKKLAAMQDPHLEEGLFGRAFRFNGKPREAGGFILSGGGVRNSKAAAVALWFRCAGANQQATLLENRNRYRLGLDGANAVWVWTQGESNFKLETPLPQPSGEWMHLAWTCDGKKATAYVNGAPAASCDSSGGEIGTKGDGGYSIRIGGRFLTSGMDHLPTFDGWMDELRVYKRALTAVEIALLAKDPRAK